MLKPILYDCKLKMLCLFLLGFHFFNFHTFVLNLQIDEKASKCFVQFEDNSEFWVMFKDIQRGKNKN